MFVSLFAMLLSRSRVMLGMFMLTARMRDVSLSETQSCWQLISNRAMLLPYARGL
jgi:hypothetical protein